MRIGGRTRRQLIAFIVALAAVAGGTAVAAAALSVTSERLSANGAPIGTCDPDGFVIDGFTLNGNNEITAVAISGIDAACNGGALKVSLTRADDVSIGSGGPLNVAASTVSVPIVGLSAASLVKHEVIIIVGP
ncbi:MAG: hypothetical protein IT360_04870 [Gemmatimonadaceae bacterium]|nr:hypothetical protein [Gemmatimonadaceae bacterium]